MIKLLDKQKVFVLPAVFVLICVSSYSRKSATFDEVQHLSCGFLMNRTGSLEHGISHPPLFRSWIGIPFLFMKLNYPQEHQIFKRTITDDPGTWSIMPDYDFGNEFIYHSGNNPAKLFFWGRFMSVLLAVMLGVLVYLFSKKLYGMKAALFSLFLFSFSPTIIAHARLTVNDIAGAFGFISVLYFLYLYLEKGRLRNLFLTGFFLAVSLLLKFNTVLLLPFVAAALLLSDRKKSLYTIPAVLFICLFLINVFYGFNGTFSEKFTDPALFAKVFPFGSLAEPFRNLLKFLPVPKFYLNSFIYLLLHNLRGHSSFLMNNYSNFGWWYYFPVAFLVKTPLITLVMTCVLFYSFIFEKPAGGEKILVLFFVFYWIFSITAKINIGHRHILPVYPALFILFGRVFNRYKKLFSEKLAKYGFPAAYIISTQIYFPHYLPYFNLMIRPENGYKYLVDSNLDWGQDLPALRKFMEKHDNPSLILSYFGTASPGYYGIKYQELLNSGMGFPHSSHVNPYDADKEYLAVSATNLQGLYYKQHNMFSWLKEKKPHRKLGYSIFIYDISDDDRSAAVLGEIYRSYSQPSPARRQYERVIWMSKNPAAAEWAEGRLRELEEKYAGN